MVIQAQTDSYQSLKNVILLTIPSVSAPSYFLHFCLGGAEIVYLLSENCLLISLYKSSNLKNNQTNNNNFLARSSSLCCLYVSAEETK